MVAGLRGAVIGSAVWMLAAGAAATGAVAPAEIDVLLLLARSRWASESRSSN